MGGIVSARGKVRSGLGHLTAPLLSQFRDLAGKPGGEHGQGAGHLVGDEAPDRGDHLFQAPGLYLAVVLDLFSRQVVGWSMQPRIDWELAISALLMAVWRRRPSGEVLVHSDQGSQFSSYDWQDFLREHNLKANMSRRGNCHDNAVAESFFQLLKRERSVAGPNRTERQRGATCSTTSKCSTTPNVATETTTGCRRQSSRGGTSTRSRVSRRPGSIHTSPSTRQASRRSGSSSCR